MSVISITWDLDEVLPKRLPIKDHRIADNKACYEFYENRRYLNKISIVRQICTPKVKIAPNYSHPPLDLFIHH